MKCVHRTFGDIPADGSSFPERVLLQSGVQLISWNQDHARALAELVLGSQGWIPMTRGRTALRVAWSNSRETRREAIERALTAFIAERTDARRMQHELAYAVFDDRNRMVGDVSAVTGLDDEDDWSLHIWIHPSHRRRRHGAYAVRSVGAMAIELGGATRLVMSIHPRDRAATLFARYLGFSESRLRPSNSSNTSFHWVSPSRASIRHSKLGSATPVRVRESKQLQDKGVRLAIARHALQIAAEPGSVRSSIEQMGFDLDATYVPTIDGIDDPTSRRALRRQHFKTGAKRSAAMGALGRLLSFAALGIVHREPDRVREILAARMDGRSRRHYANRSVTQYAVISPEGRFIGAVMDLITVARIDILESSPDFRELLAVTNELQDEYLLTGLAIDVFDEQDNSVRYEQKMKQPVEYNVSQLLDGAVDLCSGSVMDGVESEMRVMSAFIGAVADAWSRCPDGMPRVAVECFDALQRAYSRNGANLTGVLLNVGINKLDDTLGKRAAEKWRAPLRSDEIHVEFDSDGELEARFVDPSLTPREGTSRGGRCPAQWAHEAVSESETWTIIHAQDSAYRLDFAARPRTTTTLPFATESLRMMSSGEAMRRVCVMMAPALWAGHPVLPELMHPPEVDPSTGYDLLTRLVDEQRRRALMPYSVQEPTFGFGPVDVERSTVEC